MLEVDMKTTIRTLYKKEYNKTQIGRMLGIDRKTVRKVLKENEEHQGSSNHPSEPKTGILPSMLDDYREFIEIQLAKDLLLPASIRICRKNLEWNRVYDTSGLCSKNTQIQASCLHVSPFTSKVRSSSGFWIHWNHKSRGRSQKSLDIRHVIKLFPIYETKA